MGYADPKYKWILLFYIDARSRDSTQFYKFYLYGTGVRNRSDSNRTEIKCRWIYNKYWYGHNYRNYYFVSRASFSKYFRINYIPTLRMGCECFRWNFQCQRFCF